MALVSFNYFNPNMIQLLILKLTSFINYYIIFTVVDQVYQGDKLIDWLCRVYHFIYYHNFSQLGRI